MFGSYLKNFIDCVQVMSKYWVSSREGLFLFDVETGKSKRFFKQSCFGCCVGHQRVFLFSYNEFERTLPTSSGMIVSFKYEEYAEYAEIYDVRIEVTGLDNGVHQIVLHEDKLWVQETYIQQLKSFDLDDEEHVIQYTDKVVHPFERAVIYHYLESPMYDTQEFRSSHANYRHMNSITFQDGFAYILSSYLGRIAACAKQKPTISIFTQDFKRKLAEIDLPESCIPHDIVMLGSQCLYVTNTGTITKFDIVNNKILEKYPFHVSEKKWQRGLSFDGERFVVGSGQTIQLISKSGKLIMKYNVSCYPCMITRCNKNNEYNNVLSDVRRSYVKTHLSIPQDLCECHEAFINACELVIQRYSTGIHAHTEFKNTNTISSLTSRDVECVNFCNDIAQIMTPEKRLFNNLMSVQYMLRNILVLFHSKDDKMIELLDPLKVLLERSDFKYDTSGFLHLCLPKHGMGWHNNIENLKDTSNCSAKRYYLLHSSCDTFGSSFFLYRHPISGFLHFIPDLTNTMKEFDISLDPFWHAFYSNSSIRMSLGLKPKNK